MTDIITGTVKWFNAEKGFGFISSPERGDVFVPVRALAAGRTTLSPGEAVYFTVRETPRGPEATQVHVGAPPPPPKPALPTLALTGAGEEARARLQLVVRPVDPRPLTRAGKRRPSAIAFVAELDAASIGALPAELPRASAPSAVLVLIPIKHWEALGLSWQSAPTQALLISGMIGLNPLAPGMLTLHASYVRPYAAEQAGRATAAQNQMPPVEPGEN